MTGDGILTSLKLMEAMLESKATLSQLHKEVVIYPQLLENVRVKDKKAVLEDKAVNEVVSEVEKELGDNGRILVRESGTEPVIRVMTEAASIKSCREMTDRVLKVMKEQGHVIG
jgi:phosphoglucosamine mutase